MRDSWRRRLDALNDGRPQPPPEHALPPSETPRGASPSRVLAAIGAGAVISLVAIGIILAFPLIWERTAHSCSALDSLLARQAYLATPRAVAPRPVARMTSDAEVPAWFRCQLVYWRRLEIRPMSGEALQTLARSVDGRHAALLGGSGLVLGLLALGVVNRRRRRTTATATPKAAGEDAFSVLGVDPATVTARMAPPPVDLSKPISGEAAWKAMRSHASDAAYRRAVETLRLRYQLVGNQMLLPNTLREVMARSGATFREAVLRVAEDDGVGGRR